MLFTLAVYLYYLYYRAAYTINPSALTFSLLFYYAEIHGFIALALYFFQLWDPTERKNPPAPSGLHVDVLIPTYNEDPTILRKTLVAAKQMTYPHTTYVCDDGQREEIRLLAQELGCQYLTRENRLHAKAGNLNHALSKSQGDFVVVFDADYVPAPNFLEQTLGYFSNEKIAFVQTPQHYYNTDSFTFRLKKKTKRLWTEQDVFYRLIMPGRDRWDAAYFVGTGTVFRRKALSDVGNFAIDSITEDLETSIKIYRKGWKSAYHNEILSTGLAAKDVQNYRLQKMRWCEGNVNAMFRGEGFLGKGLSWSQSTCFFAVFFGWFIGFPKVIFFATPALLLLLGEYPIINFDVAFFSRYLFFLVTTIAGFKIASRGYGTIFYDEQYNMLNFATLIRGCLRALLGKKTKFLVSGKGKGRSSDAALILPQIALTLLAFVGAAWGAMKLGFGVSNDYIGLGIATLWAFLNGLLALSVVRSIGLLQHQRQHYRTPSTTCVEILATAEDGHEHRRLGVTSDLNDMGFLVTTYLPLPYTESVTALLHLGNTILTLKGKLRFYSKEMNMENLGFNYGIEFDAPSAEDKDKINTFCFTTGLPYFFHRHSKQESFLTRFIFWYRNREFLKKREVRLEYNFPILLSRDLSFTQYPSEKIVHLLHEVLQGIGFHNSSSITACLCNPSDTGIAWDKLSACIASVSQDISSQGLAFVTGASFEIKERLYALMIVPSGVLPLEVLIERKLSISAANTSTYGVSIVDIPKDFIPLWESILALQSGSIKDKEQKKLTLASKMKVAGT